MNIHFIWYSLLTNSWTAHIWRKRVVMIVNNRENNNGPITVMSINYTRQQDFGTWKVYCVSNVTFHAEFKYAIKLFPSPTVFAQWLFYYSFFGILGILFSDFLIHEPIFQMVLNRGWSQTIYHYQITSCMCSEAGSEWDKRRFMALGILLSRRVWRLINTPVLHI
jgi:hypothetical protein